MAFDKNTLRSSHRYLSKAVILIIPGMVILQLVFHKGLLSGNIHDIPELILLIVWSVFFSVPYYIAATLAMFWLSSPLEDFAPGGELLEKSADYYEESVPFTILLLLTTVGSYKVMLWLNWPRSPAYFGINREYVFCAASVAVAMLASAPFGLVYYSALAATIDFIFRHKRIYGRRPRLP